MVNMLIVGRQPGQLCNSLFTFAHVLANAIENDYLIWNPAFIRYARFFKATGDKLPRGYPVSRLQSIRLPGLQTVLYRLINALGRYGVRYASAMCPIRALDISQSHDDVGVNYDMTGLGFCEQRSKAPILVTSGWLFRDHAGLSKHGDAVRRFFEPLDLYQDAVNKVLETARQNCDVLVGVHIRQGDYREYCGGRYHFETGDYINIMRKLVGLWADRRVKFLICSNQSQDKTCFADLPHVMGPHQVIEDLYALAGCDYLIGPPSTFSQWASFYGKVPLCTIESPVELITPNRFHVHKG